jgi:hypothetical protein
MNETKSKAKQPTKLNPEIWKTLLAARFLHTMGEAITLKRLAELRRKTHTTVGYHLKVLRNLGIIEPTKFSDERAEKGKFGSNPIKLNPAKTTEILRENDPGGEWLDRDEKWQNGLEDEIRKLLRRLKNLILEDGWTVTKNENWSPFFIKTLNYIEKKIEREDLRKIWKETGFVTAEKEKAEENQLDKSPQPRRKEEIAPSHGKLGGGSKRKQKKLVREFLTDPERAEAEAEKSKHSKYHGVSSSMRTKEFWFLYNNRVWKIDPDKAKWLPKKGEKFETHPRWKHFNKGRIQADENGATYEEWFDCLFEYFKDNGPNGYPLPNQLHGPRAQDHWNEWQGSGSQFVPYGWNDPLFPPSEYAGKSSQVEYYDRVMGSYETATRNINPNFPDMWQDDLVQRLVSAVLWEKIAPAYLEKYHPELFAKVKEKMGEGDEDS